VGGGPEIQLTSDIATLLDVSERTVERHWKLAKLWLYRELNEASED
jgi:DNA-directed RNA polymerase specialized sigma24 family protein